MDIAVGPFNIDGNIGYNNEEIERAISVHREFINKLVHCSEENSLNVDEFLCNKNENPRCFLSIEIEGSGSRKHMLGDLANASILGAIGIIIPFNGKKLSQFKKIEKYVALATNAGKIKSVFKNVLIISKDNFLRIIDNTHQARV